MTAHTNKGTPTLEMGNENIKEKSPHPLLRSTRLTPKFPPKSNKPNRQKLGKTNISG